MKYAKLYKDLYTAFLKVAEEIGDDVYTLSCYAKHGFFSDKGNKEKTSDKES